MARLPMMDVNLIFDLRRKKPQAIHIQSFPNITIGSEIAAIRATPVYKNNKLTGLKYDIVQSIGSTTELSFHPQSLPELMAVSKESYDWIIKVNCKIGKGLSSCEIDHTNLNELEDKDKLDVQFTIDTGEEFGSPPGICRVVLYR